MVISSRTPEGRPNRCPVCGSAVKIEPSDPAGDAPCPHCGHLLWFTWEDAGDAVVVKLTCANLGSEDLDTLIDKLSEMRGRRRRLVLDLGHVQYLSDADISNLFNLNKKVAGVIRKLRLENVHPDLLEVFRITRLDQVFDIGR